MEGRFHRWLLLGTLALLLALSAWWAALLGRLANESYDLAVQVHGEASQAAETLARRRTMIAAESLAFTCIPLILLTLAWRGSVREARQQARIEAMLAASTHELKTPIAGLRALLESLQSGVLPVDAAGPHLARGLAACGHLETIAEGVLVRQAVLAGAAEIAVRPLREWMGEAIALRPRREHIRIDLGGQGHRRLRLPANAFRIVMDNLLDNAEKYAPDSEVRIVARRDGADVAIDVIDRGPGFSAGDADTIFEPYRRGASGSGVKGTGLGLFLARSVAEASDGRLEGRSAGPGLGATFTYTVSGLERDASPAGGTP